MATPNTKQVRVILVQFDGGENVLINVKRGVTDDTGKLYEDDFENVNAKDADLAALAVANGVAAGRWGNQEVEQFIAAQQIVVTPAVAAVPEVPAVLDEDGVTILKAAVPAVPAVAAVMGPRFNNLPIVW